MQDRNPFALPETDQQKEFDDVTFAMQTLSDLPSADVDTINIEEIEEDARHGQPISLTLRQIHQAILNTNNFMDAAHQLGYYSPALLKYLWEIDTGLALHPHTDFIELRRMSENMAEKNFPNYNTPVILTEPTLSLLTNAPNSTMFGKPQLTGKKHQRDLAATIKVEAPHDDQKPRL